MDWIKKHYDRLALLIGAIVLIVSSALIYLNIQALPEAFAEAQSNVPRGEKLKEKDLKPIKEATAATSNVPTWGPHKGSLFVSRAYLVKDGALIDPTDGTEPIHPPIPNEWLLTNNLDILNPNLLSSDPDGDGFTVLDEYLGKTDPNNPKTHPPLHTKIQLKQFRSIPFRLRFSAYDGDSFQISTLDNRMPSQFLKVGDQIQHTKFKITKFEEKDALNPKTGEKDDVSELTVVNEETGEQIVLVLRKVVDSPSSYGIFYFPIDNTEYRVKKNETFSLKAEPEVQYRLNDIKPDHAIIENLSTGEQIKVSPVK